MACVLKEALNLEEAPIIDQAHRALQRSPRDNEPLQHRIACVRYCLTYKDIMQRATSMKDLTFLSPPVQIFGDLQGLSNLEVVR